jgi:hypothetical protein
MTRLLRYICPILSVGLLAFAYFLAGLRWPVMGLLVFGGVWIIGLALSWAWVPPLALFATFGAAALGFIMDLSPLFLIPAAILALLAWDLAGFHALLCLASPDDDTSGLERRHLGRVFAIALLGGILAAFALILHFKLSFEWIILLVLFTVWGIGQVLGRLLNKEA